MYTVCRAYCTVFAPDAAGTTPTVNTRTNGRSAFLPKNGLLTNESKREGGALNSFFKRAKRRKFFFFQRIYCSLVLILF